MVCTPRDSQAFAGFEAGTWGGFPDLSSAWFRRKHHRVTSTDTCCRAGSKNVNMIMLAFVTVLTWSTWSTKPVSAWMFIKKTPKNVSQFISVCYHIQVLFQPFSASPTSKKPFRSLRQLFHLRKCRLVLPRQVVASHRRANVENQWLYPETNTWYSLRTGKSPFLKGKSSISMGHLCGRPSGKHTTNSGKSPFSMAKSTISMAIFTSYVTNYQRVTLLYVLHIEPRKNAKKHIPIRRTSKAHRLWPRSGKTSVFPKLVSWSSSIFFSSEWLFWSQNRTDPWQPMADAFNIILIPVRVNPGTLAPLVF